MQVWGCVINRYHQSHYTPGIKAAWSLPLPCYRLTSVGHRRGRGCSLFEVGSSRQGSTRESVPSLWRLLGLILFCNLWSSYICKLLIIYIFFSFYFYFFPWRRDNGGQTFFKFKGLFVSDDFDFFSTEIFFFFFSSLLPLRPMALI